MTYKDYLSHHGIKKMKWGKKNGPPYPLTNLQRSADENQANPTSASARMLRRKGINSRFNAPNALTRLKSAKNRVDDPGGNSSSGSSSSSNNNDNKTYEPDVKESRLTKFSDKYKDIREQNLASKSSATSSEEDGKKKKSSGLTDEQRAQRELERQQDRAERKARQAQRDKEREEDRAERKARQAQRDKEREEDRAYKLAQRAEKEAAKLAKEKAKEIGDFLTEAEVKVGSGSSTVERGKSIVDGLISSELRSWMSESGFSGSKNRRERALRIVRSILFSDMREMSSGENNKKK